MLLSRMKVKDGRIVTKDSIFAVVQSGGSVGEQAGEQYQGKKIIKKGFPTLEEAKAFASRWNAMLSPGEKQYYKIKYSAIEMKDSTKDSTTEGSKVVVNTENHVNENAIAVSVNESDCLVRFENGDEETVPIEAVSAFESMANDECANDADNRFVEEYKGYKIYKNPIGLRAIPNGGGESIDDIRYGGGDLIELKKKIDRKNRGQDQEPTETESQIAELTKNMDAARARGYDISAYQKEIAKLKSMDALNAKMKLSQSAAIAMIQKMYPNTQYSEDNRGSLIFAFNGNIVGQYDIETKTLYYQFKSSQDKYTGDPLTDKGKEIMASLKEQYGEEKGEQVFYAMKNSGKIGGID